MLGIETSCDETAAAVVDGERRILSNVVWSQIAKHQAYGGVVPEIAARSHLEALDGIIRRAMEEAGLDFPELDGVAVAGGPGLIGGLLVGVMSAKAIAWAHGKPFLAVNHLEAHALTARLTDEVSFPFLLLLVSGGHCQILGVEGVGRYRRYGGTMDDALGEAYDKTAKLLGLPYPGGPQVEALAQGGNPLRFALPRPMKGREGADFSFSGLKTAVRQALLQCQGGGGPTLADKADLCASFQEAVADTVIDRLAHAIARFREEFPKGKQLVMAGGVAANRFLRARVEALAAAQGLALVAPPVALCTDNAAMVAWAGIERLRLGLTDALAFEPRARWPLF
jgi:N6-L-threonylcarbamoyladenine synthase